MKKFIIIFVTLLFGTISVYALTNNFSIDYSKLSFSANGRKELILNNFNKEYTLSHSISSVDIKLEKEIIELTKKTTYLLLGDFNNTNENSEDYYKRHQDYLAMGTYNSFPKDENSSSGYDESIQNYAYASISEYAVPTLFLQFNEHNIQYSYFGDIRITVSDNLIISTISLPNIKIKRESIADPRKYDIVETNLLITYYFLEVNGNYTLCYLFGETKEDLESYFSELENNENKSTMQIASSYDSNLKQLYDYSKLDDIDDNQFNTIYDTNKNNIVILNSYYNNYVVATANGFFINDGIVVTTWNFIEKSLVDAQFIALKDNDGNSYEMDGIITVNSDTDIAIIKLKNKTGRNVILGDSNKIKVEDPAIVISSKTSVGLTLQKGIVVANDGYIQSAIPLVTTDEGSPLFDQNGNVIGMNTAKQVNSSISLAINSQILKEVQDKFNNINFDSIEVITFEKLKEQFYYVKYNEEIVKNNIPSSKWNTYSKIGNIEENIKLELTKASYKDNVVSLRYKNDISNYISSMQLSSAFREQLIKDGYSETLSGSKKCIYENGKYQVIIMDDFDCLIVVMVKL